MGDSVRETIDLFDQSSGRYHEFFPPGSREDVEFRLTRKLVLTARRWTAISEDQIKAATGQSRSRWQILLSLAFADPAVTTSALSLRLGIKWPPLVRTLNELEADGLVRRTGNPDDKRSRLIEITPAGYEVAMQVQPVLAKVRADVLAGLDQDELILATRLLDTILSGATQ
jgi:MarR family transcriptional regulator for hemolysin